MAHRVIDEKYLDEFPREEEKKGVKETIVVAASKVSSNVAGILDYLITLTAAFWYYFFIGLAILCKRRIPKEWLKLGTHFGMTKVTQRISRSHPEPLQKVSGTKNTPKRTFKVIDIDTKRPMKVLKATK